MAGEVPEELTTRTSTRPAACRGVDAVTVVASTWWTDLARAEPKSTLVTVPRCAPLIVTLVRPSVLPLAGDTESTDGPASVAPAPTGSNPPATATAAIASVA